MTSRSDRRGTRRFARLLGGLGVALALLAFAPARAAVLECEVQGQAVDPANGATTAGKTGTMRCIDRDTGLVAREEALRDGKFVGMRRFFVQGKLQREGEVNEKGNAQGRQREFALDGTLLRDAVYDNGSAVGLVRAYHLNGQLYRASFFEAGSGGEGGQGATRETVAAEFTSRGQLTELRCGSRPRLAPAVDDQKLCGFAGPVDVELFDEQGAVKAKMKYEQGRLLRATYMGDDGQPARAIENSPGQRIERQFWRDGSLRREVQFEAMGARFERVREQEFAEQGKLQRDRHWREGRQQTDREYYLNGQMRRESEQIDANTIRVREYRDNGTLSSEGMFLVEAGSWRHPIGSHKTFGSDGKPLSEVVYDERGRSVREREWDGEGKLVRDDEVFADGSRKVLAR
ncbi:MAG: hypothetical protein QM674_14940 [Burkholderiaceae bacterium]